MADKPNTKSDIYNLLNYVKDSDKTFDESGFNVTDGLVMSQISNMNLGSLGIDLYSGKSKTFAEIWEEINPDNTGAINSYSGLSKKDAGLIEALAGSVRFQNMSVSNFVKDPVTGHPEAAVEGFESVGSQEFMEQFAAATITYRQNGETYNYVSYRATDSSDDGWAEDMAMLFSERTQAQADANNYMNIVAGMIDGKIVGGGHSKGGGDFEYAYLFCEPEVRDRIVRGYIYDGPGLSEEVLSRTEYYDRYLQITEGSFICPQDSIVGMLLHESENAVFVHSVESGFMAHDPYSWQIDPATGTFVPDKQSDLSILIDEATDNAVALLSPTEKQAFFTYVAYLLYFSEGDGLEGLGDLFAKNWKNKDGSINWGKIKDIGTTLGNCYFMMPEEQRKAFLKSTGVLVSCLLISALGYVADKIEDWVETKIKQIGNAIKEAYVAAVDWLVEQKDRFKQFLDDTYNSIVSGIRSAGAWLKNLFGKKDGSAAYSSQIALDTYKLSSYAQRLQAVNGRIVKLDRRIDDLYGKIGLLDLWNLMKADLLISYNKNISRCADYLANTASGFSAVENTLINSL